MKIIRVGRIEPEIFRFECIECGCIFEADPKEVEQLWPEDGYPKEITMMAECPCCYSRVYQ